MNITTAERAFLRASDSLSRFSGPTVDAILSACVVKRFERKQIVHKRGIESDGIYFMISGQIHFTTVTAAGHKIIVDISRPGDCVGEATTLDNGGRVLDAYAAMPTRVACLSPSATKRIAADYPDFNPTIIALFCSDKRQALEDFSRLLMYSSEQILAWRIFSFLGSTTNGSEILLGQEDLAALVGVSRQSINTILKKWGEAGITETKYGYLRVLNVQRLQDIFQ